MICLLFLVSQWSRYSLPLSFPTTMFQILSTNWTIKGIFTPIIDAFCVENVSTWSLTYFLLTFKIQQTYCACTLNLWMYLLRILHLNLLNELIRWQFLRILIAFFILLFRLLDIFNLLSFGFYGFIIETFFYFLN